ncbi:hypothetical protein [Porphyrobacter sp. CACIAM 03H1]|jgi:hypothetical protein|uniref:hypothetical protein n=1 Tax=Porphyrobacter sp. CACIAM 03H1 TaxID=2003315 RepID=UPI000B5A53C0|nr:hypothetical protein [Porphyrobacter sp. CACIAM 03H1]ASJ90830.1 hypothetical protein CBR61_07785 [Porphyrobacter sp. CACIAM 03H1]
MPIFGRKKPQPQPRPEPQRFAPEPRPSQSGANDGADAAIAMLSQALGLDLDFESGFIFAPSLWTDPAIGPMLERNGLKPHMAGNRLALLKSPSTIAKLLAMDPESPLRSALEKARFGMVLYNPDAENGYADGLVALQREKLHEYATRADLSEEARKYATIHLMMFSEEVMRGKVKLG